MCFALLYIFGICNSKVNCFLFFPLRHQLEILLGDHLLPYNMTVYQAIKQFGLVRLISGYKPCFLFTKALCYLFLCIFMDLYLNEVLSSFSVMKTKTLMTNKVSWADRVFGFQHTPYGKCLMKLERRFWATSITGRISLARLDGGLSQIFKLTIMLLSSKIHGLSHEAPLLGLAKPIYYFTDYQTSKAYMGYRLAASTFEVNLCIARRLRETSRLVQEAKCLKRAMSAKIHL